VSTPFDFTEKVTKLFPAGTITVLGIVVFGEVSLRVTVVPPAGAGVGIETVARAVFPPTNLASLSLTLNPEKTHRSACGAFPNATPVP
jgi:hypothetical protein